MPSSTAFIKSDPPSWVTWYVASPFPSSFRVVLTLERSLQQNNVGILGGGVKDYKEFLNLELALAYRGTSPQAVRYFFRLFDLSNKRYLTYFDLHYFLKVIPPVN